MEKSLNPWPWKCPEPGVYFNMPFEQEYLKIPALSSTLNKKLLISITDFYNVAWFNPLRDALELDVDTKAKLEGRGTHKRILEGRKAFYEEFAPDYEDMGEPGILRTSGDISMALGRIGKPTTGTKTKLKERLKFYNKSAKFLDEAIDQHRANYPGRQFMAPKTVRYIELCAAMVEHHPTLRGWLAGGYPEVTVVWYDEELGVMFKIRVDYLKIRTATDLKTFANVMEQEIDLAIWKTIRNRKYAMQSWLYIRGIEQARKLVAQGKVFGADNIDPAWLKKFSEEETDDYRFIFTQKKSPVVRGKFFSVRDPKFNQVGEGVAKACQLFHSAYKTFGEGAWIDVTQPDMLTFDESM